ncbi:MAG: hypothetical protein HYS25_10150 [Ignavibacteriales bacterium]|nr:hypothetical protein [Ignavibacteriales bacterium]
MVINAVHFLRRLFCTKFFQVTQKFLLIALFFIVSKVEAQSISVSAITDTASYRVGDYITYELEIKHGNYITAHVPSVKDSIKVLEFIKELPFEKKDVDGKIIERYKFIFSKYDSGKVTIPSLKIGYSEGSSSVKNYIATLPVTITVHTLQVNTQQDIRDVKEPLKLPLDWLLIIIVLIVVSGLAAGGYYLYKYYKKKKEGKIIEVPEVVIPPHEIALTELRTLDAKKFWQNGLVKEYHSEITEIVRKYFEARFNFKALEMTSSEILAALSCVEEAKNIVSTAENFFSNADLVKFAKFEPMPKVNDEMMAQAYRIVDETIPKPQPAVTPEVVNVQ